MEPNCDYEDTDTVLYITNKAQDVSINMDSISKIAEEVLFSLKISFY